MNKTSKLTWALAVLGIVLLAFGTAWGIAREKYEEKFAKTEALAVDGKVVLVNVSGDTEIRSWKENSVKIDAVKVSEAATLDKAKENAKEVTIEVTNEGNVVRIETKYPERKHFWGGDSVNVSVSYVIMVPAKASVDVKSVSGDVKLEALGGPAKVNSVSGNVDVLGAAGADVKLVSGDLTLQNIAGDAFLKSVSGNVKATKIKGSVELESVSGDIDLLDVADARTVTGKTVSGNITYRGTVMPGGNYELKSHSGDVTLTIPASAAFDIDANTFSGVIDNEFSIEAVGKISPREVHGTVNKGGARIQLSTFSGNIELKKY